MLSEIANEPPFTTTSSRRSTTAPAGSTVSTAAGEYLTFRLGAEEYGIDILRVQEIRGYTEPTRMANAPAFIKGVINLRGVIVPIADLRISFGIADPQYDSFTVVIVLNIAERVIGIVVDSVTDVATLAEEDLRAVPDFNASVDADFVTAIGSIADRMLILLDIEKVAGSAALGLLAPMTH